MGHNQGIDEVKTSPFFKRVDWDHIRNLPAPIPVEVRGIADTSNFDDFGECEPILPTNAQGPSARQVQDKGEFLHYTFQRFSNLTQIMRGENRVPVRLV